MALLLCMGGTQERAGESCIFFGVDGIAFGISSMTQSSEQKEKPQLGKNIPSRNIPLAIFGIACIHM